MLIINNHEKHDTYYREYINGRFNKNKHSIQNSFEDKGLLEVWKNLKKYSRNT